MNILQDFPLGSILWYKIGGKARFLIEAEDRDDILSAVRFIKDKDIKRFFVVGLGSNLLFSDKYFDGAVLRIVRKDDHLIKRIDQNIIEAFSGEILDNLITFSFQESLCGLEWAGGLPGTVGAAVRGNVGAFGGEIKDSFVSCEVLDIPGLQIKTFEKKDAQFSYRESIFKKDKNLIILSARFCLSYADKEDLEKAKQIYLSNISYRRQYHPLDFPNCGSVFKNIWEKEKIEKLISVWPDLQELITQKWHGKVSMGYIIKRLGFSGFRIGNAQVSEKHCNFIINLGGASFSDVLGIINRIQDVFQETFGFAPELEVQIVE